MEPAFGMKPHQGWRFYDDYEHITVDIWIFTIKAIVKFAKRRYVFTMQWLFAVPLTMDSYLSIVYFCSNVLLSSLYFSNLGIIIQPTPHPESLLFVTAGLHKQNCDGLAVWCWLRKRSHTRIHQISPSKILYIYFWKPLDLNSSYLPPTASTDLLRFVQ